MFSLLGRAVSKYWLLVIVAWIVILFVVGQIAPPWDQVTHDGDFAYLPAEMPSVIGERLTREAFPQQRAKSEMAIVIARDDRPLEADDLRVADLLSQRFYNFLGAARLRRGEALSLRAKELAALNDAAGATALKKEATAAFTSARKTFEKALTINKSFAAALHNLALAHRFLGRDDKFEENRLAAIQLDPQLAGQ